MSRELYARYLKRLYLSVAALIALVFIKIPHWYERAAALSAFAILCGYVERANMQMRPAGIVYVSGFIIEQNDHDDPRVVTYLSTDSLGSGFIWTPEEAKAIRFCRRQDADGIASIFDDLNVSIKERKWPS